jgi:putative transposase
MEGSLAGTPWPRWWRRHDATGHTIYQTRQEAKAAIFDYIELFYNRLRPNQTLSYRTLIEVEAQYGELLK